MFARSQPMPHRPLGKVLTRAGVLTSRPTAFLIVLAYGAAWFLIDRANFDWHAAATLVVWLMTLFIQRAQHRDTQSIQAKLDELLAALPGARSDLHRLELEEPEDIEKERGTQPLRS